MSALLPRAAAALALFALALLPGCRALPDSLRSALPGREPVWERPPPPASDEPVVDDAALHRFELANGVTGIVLEDPRLPRVELGVAVRRGAGVVERERAGLAALTAEAMRRGAGERGALALAQAVDGLGASLGSSAGWDSMSVSLSGLARDRERLFEILADVVRRPRFEAAEVAKARSQQLASLEKAKDSPQTLARWAFARALYPEHRYGLPEEGTPESLRPLGPEEVRAFHERLFVPGNAIFFASGDVSAEAVRREAEALLGDWEAGPVPEPGPAPAETIPEERSVLLVDRPDLAQAQIVVGHDGLARTDPRRIPASLVNTVLGAGGFSSRLMERVRADEGLSYGVSSFFALRRHPGPFGAATFTRSDQVPRVVEMLLAEIERMQAEPPTEAELADAKSLRVGRFALGLETASAVTEALVDLEVYGLPRDSLDTYRGRLRAVSPADAAEVARALLHPERAAVVVVGPAEALRPKLERFGPVEVEAP